ncbi:MAG: PKD domain-containing protein [Flavobacteriales bacterium]|jgi:gliding motility-associated-like protein|nr:PKD domain-containing protein [Flavobacteriales bacterium]
MKYFIGFVWLLLGWGSVLGQYEATPFEQKVFIENKKQFNHELPKAYQDFEYCVDNQTLVLIQKNQLVYRFIERHDKEWLEEEKREAEKGGFKSEEEEEREKEKFKPTYQYVVLNWLNANPNATIEVEELSTVKYGYAVDWEERQKGKTIFCKGYKKMTIKNLYEGVDAEYFFTENQGEIKYNLIVQPHADLSQINYRYDGAKQEMIAGNIVVETIKGKLVENAPISYLLEDKTPVKSSFYLSQNNVVGFDIVPAQETIVIDPLIAVPGLNGGPPVDNGIDQWGNHYVTSSAFRLEKYDPAGTLLHSVTTGSGLYGDMLTSSTGDCFFNAVIGTNSIAYDAGGNFLWSSGGIAECWRFVLNECYGQVYSLTGKRHSVSGFATIDAATGALLNYNGGGSCCYDPHSGVVDDNGDVFTVASNPATIHHWSAANTSIATYPSPIPFGYASGYAGMQGYNGMAKLGDFLFLHNGATIAKVNKLTGALVGQKAVPNGSKGGCGGIYITSCGYLLIGSTDGVYLLDNNFNQLDFRATNGAVYDLVFNEFNQNFAVCGPGHVSEVSFNIPPCIFETNPEIVPSCNNTASGSIKLNLTGGVPSYTYVWSGNGLVANTDSVGGLMPGTYKCVYADNRCPVPTVDSVEVTVGVQTVVAAFSANDVCLGEVTEFENNSTTSVGSITNVEWDFADGNSSLLSSPENLYLTDGGYPVKLVVTATNSCQDSVDTQLVTVNPLPVADFTNPIECHNESLQFTSAATVSSGNIAQWEWHFGDHTYGNVEHPSHQYPVDIYPFLSTYDVYLKVTTNHGCVDDTMIQYRPHPMPRAAFAGENICVNTPVQFTNLSQVVAPDVLNNPIYNFDDGSALVSINNPIHTFTTAGDYNVSIIATSNNGCVNDTTIVISVYPEPIASFSANTICENEPPTQFQNLSTISGGSIVGYTWNFGDETSSFANPSHVFDEAGVYQVVLTAVSNYNCVNVYSAPVTVNAAPLSKFIVDAPEGCDEHCVQFTDLSIANSSSIVNYLWHFENGDTLTEASPNVCFTNKSNTEDISFDVRMITQNDLGCKDTLSLQDYITVYHNPLAIFSPTELQENMYESEFLMENTSIGSDGYVWDFGDGAKGFDFEPVHWYADTGTYYITLVAYTNNNCMDTTVQGISVTPVISVYVPNTFTPNGDGENDVFNLKSYGIVEDGFELFIFDRWGDQIYYTTTLGEGWDGTHKSNLSQQDTYVYKIICKDVFGEMHEYKGHINLLK